MKKIKKYTYVILGSILIGFGIDLFFKGTSIIPSGILGLTNILENKYNISASISLILFNSLALLIGAIFLPEKNYTKNFVSAFLIPASLIIFKNISHLIDISNSNVMLKTIFGASLVGYGFKLIYSVGTAATGIDILENVVFKNAHYNKKVITYILDIFLVIAVYISSNMETVMYTIITIIIIEYISKIGMLNSSDTKVFYIITSEEDRVKDYIMKELNCGLTVFDVVGGYSKTKSKVLMSAIKTKNYYKLREEIKKIDPNAFITITDTYEVINAELNTKKQ